MPTTLKATVLVINTGKDPRNGEKLASIYFGVNVKLSKEMREKISEDNDEEVTDEVAVPVLQVTMPIKKLIPYRIGSDWKVTIEDNGELNMKEDR